VSVRGAPAANAEIASSRTQASRVAGRKDMRRNIARLSHDAKLAGASSARQAGGGERPLYYAAFIVHVTVKQGAQVGAIGGSGLCCSPQVIYDTFEFPPDPLLRRTSRTRSQAFDLTNRVGNDILS